MNIYQLVHGPIDAGGPLQVPDQDDHTLGALAVDAFFLARLFAARGDTRRGPGPGAIRAAVPLPPPATFGLGSRQSSMSSRPALSVVFTAPRSTSGPTPG